MLALILLYVLVNEASCKHLSVRHKTHEKIVHTNLEVDFIPDTSVNRCLFLNNPESIYKYFGNIESKLNHDADFPEMLVLNYSGTQYLKMVVFPGSTKNSISRFEFGVFKLLKDTMGYASPDFINFFTESGITLGMSIEKLIKIKGVTYQKVEKGGFAEVNYSNTQHSILKRYNIPTYSATYYFENNLLIKCCFGFEYP